MPHVGATPQWTFAVRTCGSKTIANPMITSTSWVAKSTTARKTFRPAASLIPTMLIATRIRITAAPPMMSHGFVFSGSQKIDR